VDLSIGERQKFAIARALLRRPAIIVLDEFTSALDPEDTNRLYAFLDDREQNLGYKPTVLFSSHDYKKGVYADRIIMLAKDKHGIAAAGTFEDLSVAGGDFQRKLEASSETRRARRRA